MDAQALEDAADGRGGGVLMARLSAISALLSAVFDGEDGEIVRVGSIAGATREVLVFATDEASLGEALRSGAGGILAPVGMGVGDGRVIGVKDPRTAFARVYGRWFDRRAVGVHATAVVEDGVVMGEGCWIGPRAVVHAGTTLGDRVRVQAGAVLGADGFGYARCARGVHRVSAGGDTLDWG